MKGNPIVLLTTLSLFTIWIIVISFKEYQYPDREEIQLKVNYLSRIISEPFGRESDLYKIQEQNPEWKLFSLSFSTFALTNVYFIDTSFKQTAISLIDKAIQKAL